MINGGRTKDVVGTGISQILNGHTGETTNVEIWNPRPSECYIISGSVDKSIRVWSRRNRKRQTDGVHDTGGDDGDSNDNGSDNNTTSEEDSVQLVHYACDGVFNIHKASVRCISVPTEYEAATAGKSRIFGSGAANYEILLWQVVIPTIMGKENEGGGLDVEVLHRLELSTPRFIPLCLAQTRLCETDDSNDILLAACGTSNNVYLFTVSQALGVKLTCKLSGHDGWLRSVKFARDPNSQEPICWMGTASQDKYIRIWKFRAVLDSSERATEQQSLGYRWDFTDMASIRLGQSMYMISFTALLAGHEDWVFSLDWKWNEKKQKLQLLSTSADSSLAIWEHEKETNYWSCTARFGDMTLQKGATTATGSTGGFWTGVWLQKCENEGILGLSSTGNWRVWTWDEGIQGYIPQPGLGGHTRAVRDLSWSRCGMYLLSISNDQTTRLWAEWVKENNGVRESRGWREFGRPQIHGYDLTCISSVDSTQFVSGADEKLLRTFNMPMSTAKVLERFTEFMLKDDTEGDCKRTGVEVSETACVPVLGLSNKGVEENDRVMEEMIGQDYPPLESQLSRITLWPEREKLYGHGYEISAVTAGWEGEVIATACKASSIEHAVIRLYDTQEWRENPITLKGHTLSVLGLKFSRDDEYLLSVGRDRRVCIWKRKKMENSGMTYELIFEDGKSHTRMILSCAWLREDEESKYFVTGGRDKRLLVWRIMHEEVELMMKFTATEAITAVDGIEWKDEQEVGNGDGIVVFGTEEGDVKMLKVDTGENKVEELAGNWRIPRYKLPDSSITSLTWRKGKMKGEVKYLAIGSNDNSVRIYGVRSN